MKKILLIILLSVLMLLPLSAKNDYFDFEGNYGWGITIMKFSASFGSLK